MKKILFWITFVPLGIIMLIAAFIGAICEKYDDLIHKYERWCFNDPTLL